MDMSNKERRKVLKIFLPSHNLRLHSKTCMPGEEGRGRTWDLRDADPAVHVRYIGATSPFQKFTSTDVAAAEVESRRIGVVGYQAPAVVNFVSMLPHRLLIQKSECSVGYERFN